MTEGRILSQSSLNNPPDLAAMAATVAPLLIADTMPAGEATTAQPGETTKAQGAGHQHPRLTSTTTATVATGSTVLVPFTRTFTNKPGVVCFEIEGATSVSAQPAVFKVESWTQDAQSRYTGCVIRVWRSQTVPQNLATLLLGAVFNLFAASVVGTQFTCIAVARSDVAS